MATNWTKAPTPAEEINDNYQFQSGAVITAKDINKNFNNNLYAVKVADEAKERAMQAQISATRSAESATQAQQSAQESSTQAISTANSAKEQSTDALVRATTAEENSSTAVQSAQKTEQISVNLLEDWNKLIQSLGVQKPFGGVVNASTGTVTLTFSGKTLLETAENTFTLNPTNSTGNVQKLVFIVNIGGTFAGKEFMAGDELVATDSGWMRIPPSAAVVSVNGRTGIVNITIQDLLTTDQINRLNRNFVTTSIQSNEIAGSAVRTAHIQDGQVTQTKLGLRAATGDRVGVDIARVEEVSALQTRLTSLEQSQNIYSVRTWSRLNVMNFAMDVGVISGGNISVQVVKTGNIVRVGVNIVFTGNMPSNTPFQFDLNTIPFNIVPTSIPAPFNFLTQEVNIYNVSNAITWTLVNNKASMRLSFANAGRMPAITGTFYRASNTATNQRGICSFTYQTNDVL